MSRVTYQSVKVVPMFPAWVPHSGATGTTRTGVTWKYIVSWSAHLSIMSFPSSNSTFSANRIWISSFIWVNYEWATLFILCRDVIFLVRLQGNFDVLIWRTRSMHLLFWFQNTGCFRQISRFLSTILAKPRNARVFFSECKWDETTIPRIKQNYWTCSSISTYAFWEEWATKANFPRFPNFSMLSGTLYEDATK